MTLITAFHRSNFRTLKHFCTDCVLNHWRGALPGLFSYTRIVELMPSALIPLCGYLHSRRGRFNGISFIDSTPIIVCHPKGAHTHKLFEDIAKWGKNKVLSLINKLLTRKRANIETVNDQLKHISQIEHTRHRFVANFMANMIAGLIAYIYQNKSLRSTSR